MKLIETADALAAAAPAIGAADRLGIDCEFESTRTVRKLCLIQIATGEEVFLIDTVRLGALGPLAEAISRPEVEWIVHAGRQDVDWLDEVVGVGPPRRLFDTQVAWGLLDAELQVSLALLLYRLLGLRTSKAYQAVDWTRRPLSPPQLAYAASDVEHLFALRDALGERLRAAGKEELVWELTHEQLLPEPKPPPSLSDFRNAWQLDARQQAALRFMVEWLEGTPPERREWSPPPKTVLAVASRLPRTGSQLAAIKGVHVGWAKRHGDAFARALVRAADAADTEGFVPLEPPPGMTFERLLAEKWLDWAIAEVCAEVEISPLVAFPGALKRPLADAIVEAGGDRRAALPLLTGWRADWLRDRLAARIEA